MSDGTTAGTEMVLDINPGPESGGPWYLLPFANQVLFRADDGANGQELWISDGTPMGTSMVKDIATGSTGSDPGNLTAMDGFALFWADDGVAGKELWRSDGTEAGTWIVKDIRSGPGSSWEIYMSEIVRVGEIAYFGARTVSEGLELWRSDGTEAGTWMVKDINPGITASSPWYFVAGGDEVYFLADDGAHGEELWRSDGTADGTLLVLDFWPGPTGSDPFGMKMVNGVLVLNPITPDHGSELWTTDGTSAGTRLLAEVNPGPSGSSPFIGPTVGNDLVFSADDDEYGRELYRVCAEQFFMDVDSDGHGDPDRPTLGCTAPFGYVISDDDCDDMEELTYPGAAEFCDGADNDCDGQADEPDFSGLDSAVLLPNSVCSVRLDWTDVGESVCGDDVSYRIYRSTSPDFQPSESDRIAALVPTTTYTDVHAVSPPETYHYLVRATAGESEDTNLVRVPVDVLGCTGGPPTAIPEDERATLIALYNAANGADWTDRTGWRIDDIDFNDRGTECSWFGVWCNSVPQIVTIDLESNNLVGTVPLELGNLSALRTLNLSFNEFTGPIPTEIGFLSQLADLNLAANALSGLIPNEFCDLSALENANLRSNRLSGEIPSRITELKQLWDGSGLRLSWNALQAENEETREFVDQKHGTFDGYWGDTQTVAPGLLEIVSVGDHTVWLSWVPIPYSADVGAYEPFSKLAGSEDWESAGWTWTKANDSYPVTWLQPGSPYDFAVSTFTEPHENNTNMVFSDSTPTVTAMTADSGCVAPSIRSIAKIESTALMVDGDFDGYQWITGETTSAIEIPASASGWYWVRTFSPGPCDEAAVIFIANENVFVDDFESGDTSRWSGTSP